MNSPIVSSPDGRPDDVAAQPGPGAAPDGTPGPQRPPVHRRRYRDNRAAYLFLTPWLIGFFGLTTLPMLYSLYLSFTKFNLLTPPHWIGTDNYREMFTGDPEYLQSVKVTLVYVVLSTPLKLFLALMTALLLNRGLRALGLLRAVFYLPSLLGASVAVAVMWRQLFSLNGVVNHVLAVFGIQGQDWVGLPDYALYTLILLAAWQFGTPMLIFLAGLKEIPRDIYEAAALDGARGLRMFFRITLPLLSPMLFFNLVLETINAFQTFAPAFVISRGKGDPLDSTLLYTLYLYIRGFGSLKMGYASAMAWVLFLVIAAFTGVYFWSSRRWVHYGD